MLKIQLRILVLSLLSSLLVLNSINTNAAGRIAVKGHNGAVASSSAIASEVGIQILKDYSGKGIGKRLQNELVNESKRRGYSFITMFNDPRNTVSAKLHDSLGYETIFRIHYSEEIINDVKAIGFKKKGRFVINFLKIFNSKSGMLLLGLILKILKSSFPSLITYNEDNLRSPDIRCMLKRFEKI